MSGVNRVTGKVLEGWPHVLQSLVDIWTTPKNTRVMRRTYGAGLFGLIDRPGNRDAILEVVMAAVDAEEWEPRFQLRTVRINKAGQDGYYEILFSGIYFPRGHLGDFTAFEPRDNERVRISA